MNTNGVSIGRGATAEKGGVAIGDGASAKTGEVVITGGVNIRGPTSIVANGNFAPCEKLVFADNNGVFKISSKV